MKRNGELSRTNILNSLIIKNRYTNYLEIGVQVGINLDAIVCLFKTGVDPDINSKAHIHQTSDDFFKENTIMFDIIFIDGMHSADFVYRDITNSLEILKNGGTIIVHDMIPFDEVSQRVPRETKVWTGDGWKAFVKLRSERVDLEMRVVKTDCGCGIIRKGKQELININNYDWDYNEFVKNQEQWLNTISVEQFKELYL